ncbi:MAG: DUF4065 domain-containing protein [Ignavibacteria bacterium]|nr:DUF4065 domain-containing protein [Ignavibacteria bacterium]
MDIPSVCYSPIDIANYFLTYTDEEAGEFFSNLKLQKLVYYAQGFSLALNDAPLFQDSIEAWAHGPVIPGLYHHFKNYGAAAIEFSKDFDVNKIDEKTRELLNEVYKVYGQFSAWKLRNLSHEDLPYIEAYASPSKIITTESMRSYFKTQLKDA